MKRRKKQLLGLKGLLKKYDEKCGNLKDHYNRKTLVLSLLEIRITKTTFLPKSKYFFTVKLNLCTSKV